MFEKKLPLWLLLISALGRRPKKTPFLFLFYACLSGSGSLDLTCGIFKYA
jgi:hypothetical protein